jgi:hypothetical protein
VAQSAIPTKIQPEGWVFTYNIYDCEKPKVFYYFCKQKQQNLNEYEEIFSFGCGFSGYDGLQLKQG